MKKEEPKKVTYLLKGVEKGLWYRFKAKCSLSNKDGAKMDMRKKILELIKEWIETK